MTRSVLLISERDGQLAASVENAEPPLPPNFDERIGFEAGQEPAAQIRGDACDPHSHCSFGE